MTNAKILVPRQSRSPTQTPTISLTLTLTLAALKAATDQSTVTRQMMSRRLETKACKPCAAAKRKCDRHAPACLRCSRRHLDCTYAPSKPSSFVLYETADNDTLHHTSPSSSSQSTLVHVSSGAPICTGTGIPFSMDVDLPSLTDGYDGFFQEQLATSWFMSTDKWEIHHVPSSVSKAIDAADQRRHIWQVRHWLTQWVETSSNPFIHPRLYKARSPRCIQDTYMAVTCYVHKTLANETAVLRILEDRSESLVSEHSDTLDTAAYSAETGLQETDMLECLARVQSLLFYQIIGLYDGDIRLRHLAEKRIPILYCWMSQLIQKAKKCVCIGSFMTASPHHAKQSPAGIASASAANLAQWQNLLWYSWIMAESIRRTWLLCSSVQGIYVILRDGGGATCQGGITFTTRQGVWEAKTAEEWESLCARKSVGMVKMKEAHRLFTEAVPEEVNDFTKMVLEVSYGTDRMRDWMNKSVEGSGIAIA